MSRAKTGLFAVLAIAGLVVLGVIAYESRQGSLVEGERLRGQATLINRLSAETTRLSNLLAQVSAAQAGANEQYKEVLSLRSEITRLKQFEHETRAAIQPVSGDFTNELASLRAEIEELKAAFDEVAELRDEIDELLAQADDEGDPETPAEPAQPATALPALTEQPDGAEQPLALRVIRTTPGIFPEKLKRSVAADDQETFQEVFSRFLQSNGFATNSMAAAVFDERTGSVIVRGPPAALEQIERLTSALDQSP